ncbi:hypothetical protein RN001_009048 [Aquatica leii]|uniref:Metalloendopeptidase n=1 Tax=Aquatica leii TaxID=1421715 RepID=A0AAN7SDL3_9COLE|nr:hypothetical protein RN001_009048 [Aquatica leii]
MKTLYAVFGVAVFAVTYIQTIPISEEGAEYYWKRSDIFEGDIVLDRDQKNGVIKEIRRWPNREIPYVIGPEYTEKQKAIIKTSLTAFDKTCLKVRERNSTDKDYVYFTYEVSGCFSAVGRQGGKQKINLSKNCMYKSTVIHEFLHAVGFHHMQNNFNRDEYVTIMFENLEAGAEGYFTKYNSSYVTDFGLPYDYGSIMHYGRKDFSKNGKDTIVPKDPSAVIGLAQDMSKIDLAKITAMYKCS